MDNVSRRSLKRIFFYHFEWLALLCGLIFVAFITPYADSPTFCLLSRSGIDICPGCGLGRSMSLAMRGELQASLQMHPAGIAAILILSCRICTIIIRNHKKKKEVGYEENI